MIVDLIITMGTVIALFALAGIIKEIWEGMKWEWKNDNYKERKSKTDG